MRRVRLKLAVDDMDELLTTGFIARYCGATPITVARWIKSGKLQAIRTPGGRFRVTRDAFKRFLIAHDLPIDAKLFPGRSLRILIVDDDAGVIRLLQRVFRDSGLNCELETAADGYEAGLKIERFRPDLTILDIRMPGLSGLAVCRRIKSDRNFQKMRIIILTGYLTPENQQEALASGANLCLGKPVDPHVLLDKVHALTAVNSAPSMATANPVKSGAEGFAS